MIGKGRLKNANPVESCGILLGVDDGSVFITQIHHLGIVFLSMESTMIGKGRLKNTISCGILWNLVESCGILNKPVESSGILLSIDDGLDFITQIHHLGIVS